MNWQRLLNADLGSLLGRRAEHTPDLEAPVYWWTRLGRMARPTAAASPGTPTRYPRSLLQRVWQTGWKGPVYWNGRRWRRDVVLVAEQLRALVACNAPLAAGLASAAREEQRIRTGWTPQRASMLLRNALIAAFIVLLGAGIAADPRGLGSGSGFVMAAVMIGLVGWFLFSLLANRNSRTGVYLALERRLAGGMALSDAMTTLPRFFPRHLADLVEAGETAGNLDRAFEQFNDAMLTSLGMHRQLKAVLTYIKLVIVTQLAVVAFLLVKVVPVWAELLGELGVAPPPIALLPDLDTIIALGDSMTAWGPVLLCLIPCFLVWRVVVRFRGRRSWASRGMSSFLLLLPWFRGLVVRHNLGLIALMLHGLLRAGVPLDRALALAMGTDLLPAYRDWLSELRARVLQGESLKDALEQTRSRRLIPDSFMGLVEAGERSGQLPAMLEHIAVLYRREAEKRMHVLAALVLPAGIFIMAYITLAAQIMVFGAMARMVEMLIV